MNLLEKLPRILSNPAFLFSNVLFENKVDIAINRLNDTESVTFVYIGANDGISGNRIRNYIIKNNWAGVFVEPQKNVFAKLVRNYQQYPCIAFENAAVAETDGQINFYQSKNSSLSSLRGDEWFKGKNKGIAYLNRKLFGGSNEIIVNSITFQSLLTKHEIPSFNLLITDTEGYDNNIIRQLDFHKHQPKIIISEVLHLDEIEKKISIRLLENNGYSVTTDGWDLLAEKF